MALMSVELVNASASKDLNARVRSFRSSTKWFADAKYGVFLQWGQWGYPAHGDTKKWPQMIDDFRARYGSKAQFVALYPSFASLQLAQPRPHAQKPFQLGHISNLTLEKGLDLVLDTFRALHERSSA